MVGDGTEAAGRDLVGTLHQEATRAVIRQLVAALAPLVAASPPPAASPDVTVLCPATVAEVRAARAAVAAAERVLAS